MNKVSNIKERIKIIAENSGLTKEKFFSEIGTTSANFRGKKLETGVNSDLIDKIVSLYPDLDLHWLITGEKKYDTSIRDNIVAEPKEEEDYKAKYYDCLENYMRLNEEMNAFKKSNSNLKKPDRKVYDKS